MNKKFKKGDVVKIINIPHYKPEITKNVLNNCPYGIVVSYDVNDIMVQLKIKSMLSYYWFVSDDLKKVTNETEKQYVKIMVT